MRGVRPGRLQRAGTAFARAREPAVHLLGRISYSVYLWQQLFLGPPHVYLHPWRWSVWPLNLRAAVSCGAASYWLIERPSGRLKRGLRSAPRPQTARLQLSPVSASTSASSGVPCP